MSDQRNVTTTISINNEDIQNARMMRPGLRLNEVVYGHVAHLGTLFSFQPEVIDQIIHKLKQCEWLNEEQGALSILFTRQVKITFNSIDEVFLSVEPRKQESVGMQPSVFGPQFNAYGTPLHMPGMVNDPWPGRPMGNAFKGGAIPLLVCAFTHLFTSQIGKDPMIAVQKDLDTSHWPANAPTPEMILAHLLKVYGEQYLYSIPEKAAASCSVAQVRIFHRGLDPVLVMAPLNTYAGAGYYAGRGENIPTISLPLSVFVEQVFIEGEPKLQLCEAFRNGRPGRAWDINANVAPNQVLDCIIRIYTEKELLGVLKEIEEDKVDAVLQVFKEIPPGVVVFPKR